MPLPPPNGAPALLQKGGTHTLEAQVADPMSVAHVFPQTPQLMASLDVFVQAEAQQALPPWLAQLVPQALQLSSSEAVSAQMPLQQITGPPATYPGHARFPVHVA